MLFRSEGFIPSEGVGAVILKSLTKAEADGDQIYAVIKGSSVNHGGKTRNYSVPNPNGQAELIKASMDKAGVKGIDFDYIEAHGTGTILGDPIEISGLVKAFDTTEKQFCSIGSIKSNIGHCESAAGIASLTKVLLQIKHKTFVPSLHSQITNPNIDFENSPFKVQQKLKSWQKKNGRPRLAGISGFGAGGSNASLIIEEYPIRRDKSDFRHFPLIIILSAKNQDRLNDQVNNLYAFIKDNYNVDLHEMAFTLQSGREAMKERFALISTDRLDILKQLENYLDGKKNNVLTGRFSKETFILKGGAGGAYLNYAIEHKEADSLARAWVQGAEVNWNLIYPDIRPNRISLPTYPFAKDHYWIPTSNAPEAFAKIPLQEKLHPLVHKNISDSLGQKYKSMFTGSENFFSDHQIFSEKILPGVAYLELARETGLQASQRAVTSIKNITWLSPFRINKTPKELYINLSGADEPLKFQIYSDNIENGQLHCQGNIHYSRLAEPANVDLSILGKKFMKDLNREECYLAFERMGFNYGTSFFGIRSLSYSDDEALSKIELPKNEDYLLQPAALDSALQNIVFLNYFKHGLSLPFNLGEINIYHELPETFWSYARKRESSSKGKATAYDVDLFNEQGEILISFRNFVLLPLVTPSEKKLNQEHTEAKVSLYNFDWKKIPFTALPHGDITTSSAKLVLLVNGKPLISDQLQANLEIEVLTVKGASENEFFIEILDYFKKIIGHKTHINIILVFDGHNDGDLAFIIGLLKTAEQENPKLRTKVLITDSFENCHELEQQIKNEFQDSSHEVRYVSGVREIKTGSLIKDLPMENPNPSIREGGVYIVTGGAGGLGRIIAAHIGKTHGTKIILTGRRELEAGEFTQIAGTTTVSYYKCDVTQKQDVQQLIEHVRKIYGRINGIIHSAGISINSLISKKDNIDAVNVIAAKISGIKNIDEATKQESLDFMVLFSSISAIAPMSGQSDYASANAYLDYFTTHRNDLIRAGKRSGRTFSINWPLWADGGLRVDSESIEYLKQQWGMIPLPTSEGINIFDGVLRSNLSHCLVTFGNPQKISRKLSLDQLPTAFKPVKKETDYKAMDFLQESGKVKLSREIKFLAADILKLDQEKFDPGVEFSNYGFDSVLLTRFSNELNSKFGLDLVPTIFYNYTTVNELAGYLINEFQTVPNTNSEKKPFIIAEQPKRDPSGNNLNKSIILIAEKILKLDPNILKNNSEFGDFGFDSVLLTRFSNELNLRYDLDLVPTIFYNYPNAAALSQYFLEEYPDKFPTDVNPHGEVYSHPGSTFSLPEIKEKQMDYDTDNLKRKRIAVIGMSCKFPDVHNLDDYWEIISQGNSLIDQIPLNRHETSISDSKLQKDLKGGFFKNIGIFDAEYFNQTKNEASAMSPQQRIILELARDLFAHAGYAKSELADSDTSVYLASGAINYPGLRESSDHDVVSALTDFYKLRGSKNILSESCSDSMLGIQLACEDLLNGKAGMAIAGGINVVLDNIIHEQFDQAGLLSKSGKNFVFDHRSDGIVISEGAALVLLKDYDQAIADGDKVFGVILNSSSNKDGKNREYELDHLIGEVGVSPENVSYYESTSAGYLGEDINEIENAANIFKNTDRQHTCNVGTAKSNIGHVMSVSGIASLIKVFLQMEHATIAPIVNLDRLHSNFSHQDSPFYYPCEAKIWEQEHKIAIIASFDFYGNRRHLIVENPPVQNSIKRFPLAVERLSNGYYWTYEKTINN